MVSSAVEGLDVGAGSARPRAIDDRPYEIYRYCTVKRTRAGPKGSDPTAAGGRGREGSEWQRSKKSRKSVSPMIFSGTATGCADVHCTVYELSAATRRRGNPGIDDQSIPGFSRKER